MSESKSGPAPPEFMRPHPSEASRIAKPELEMSEAVGYYRCAS